MNTTPDLAAKNEPSMRPALWLAFGLGLATLALSTYSLLTNKGAAALPLAGLIGIGITAFSSPLIALTSAVMAARDVKRASGAVPVHATLWRALRVFRYLLALDIALIPVIVASGMYLILALPAIFGDISICDDPGHCVAPTITMPDNVVGQTFGILFAVLGLCGLCLLLPSISILLTRFTHSAAVGILVSVVVWSVLAYVVVAKIS